MTSDHDLAKLTDELGGLRFAIRTLRAREAELRARLLDARPNAPVEGRSFTLNIRRSKRRSFDHSALPENIRNDPRLWKVSETTTVVTKAIQTAPPRTLPTQGQTGHLLKKGDDFQVIEPF